jgi:hypothetical protein
MKNMAMYSIAYMRCLMTTMTVFMIFFEHANITADEKRKRWIKRLKERNQF